MKFSLTAFLLVLLLLGLTPAPAWGQTGVTTPYNLNGGSRFERGCFGSCTCPVFSSKLQGSFDLRALPPDPLYSHYAIDHVDWTVHEPGHPLKITGSGTYRIGGRASLEERMTLDLSVEGAAPQHFDSGNVSSGGDFPSLTIQLRLHGASACTDTLITLDASPGMLGLEPRGALAPRAAPILLRDLR